LSSVYGILEQANGHIMFTSQGTTFCIFLPGFEGAPPADTTASQTDAVVHVRETALIVEDEVSVCELVRPVLDAHGYTVHTAAQPEEAEMFCCHV
jgi:hypothetical protein